MSKTLSRKTVDLAAYPDLVVIYLGMRVNSPRGMQTLLSIGPKIKAAVAAKPDGLLLHEPITYSLFPLHVGMRQYWRDFESLERWSHEWPHREWWTNFLRGSHGTGFWHETYFRRGGMEAIYDGIPKPLGLAVFAPVSEARGSMFSARRRARRAGDEVVSPVDEGDFYTND